MVWFRVIFWLGMVIISSSTFAQIEKIEVEVNGLSCAFCAYGLEKRLKEVSGVAKVTISVEKGMTVLEPKLGEFISLEDIGPSITKAGFTPGKQIRATLVGKVLSKGNHFVLTLDNPRERFILNPNPKLKQLIGSIKEDALTVRITGVVSGEKADGHKKHPFSILVKTFEILP